MSLSAYNTAVGAVARALAHAAEHDRGECPIRCQSTAAWLRKRAEVHRREQAERFEALDDVTRALLSNAASKLRRVDSGEWSKHSPEFQLGVLIDVFGDVLDSFGMLVEEVG